MRHRYFRTNWRRKQFRVNPGASPGTIEVQPSDQPPTIRLITYGPEGYEEAHLDDLHDLDAYRGKRPFLWIHLEGFGNLDVLTTLQAAFSLHTLAVEDVVNQNQRPKVDLYDNHAYMVLVAAEQRPAFGLVQVNLFLGDGFLLSMVETPASFDEPVRRRIRAGGTRIRGAGPGYLAYALMDAVVDQFFPIVDDYAARLISLEVAALGNPTRDDIAEIHAVNQELMALRRALLPLKDVTGRLYHDPHPYVHETTRVYFRDCNDHVVRILDELDADRELSRNLVDTCLSTMSNRMNEIMKVLTIISTIFIPLGFIAGIYGMNFDPDASPFNMPELSWYFGYPAALLLMLFVAAGLLFFFRTRGWLGAPGGGDHGRPGGVPPGDGPRSVGARQVGGTR